MSRVFDPENSFMSGFNRVIDCLVLAMLWLLCSLPVVTIGTASGALYYAYHKGIRQGRGYPWKEFFAAFKANFKQTLIIWLIALVFLGLSAFACLALRSMRETMPVAGPLQSAGMVIVGFGITWCIYLFPYQARFENTTGRVMKNSAILAVANLLWSVLLFLIFAAAVILIAYNLALLVPVVAVYIWLKNKIMEHIFRKLMSAEALRSELEYDRR